jgi:leader peptidase (prepilin peptidase)/N-methyltransferase
MGYAMNIIVSIIYGIVGLIVGYRIQDISYIIIEYKKRKQEVNKDCLIYSKWVMIILSIVNGLMWTLAGLYLPNPIIGLIIALQFSIGIIIGFIDISIRIIPNELVLMLLILGIVFQILNFGLGALIYAAISMIVMMTVFVSVAAFVGFGKVGAGDVKLAGAVGLALGYPLVITAVYMMSVVLFIYIAVGLLTKKISLATMFPLAPFIISGFAAALISILV